MSFIPDERDPRGRTQTRGHLWWVVKKRRANGGKEAVPMGITLEVPRMSMPNRMHLGSASCRARCSADSQPACLPACLPALRFPGTMLADIHLTPLRCPLESPSTFKRGASMTQVPCQEPSCWGAMCNDGATKSPRASIRGNLRRLRSFLQL